MSEKGDMEKRLYEVCLSGSVPALNALIQEDQLILNRVNSFTDFFNDTPLHVAASCGHLDIAKVLLSQKPKLATELNSLRCSPLHLASTEGHVEIVQELLRVNIDVCLARDQEDRTPLHLAAIKERVEVIRELLRAKPESIHEKLDRGETVLHLCVKYNKLEALKTLVEDLRDNDKFLLSCRDDDGNTTLHLAAALKQMNTIKYLLKIKSVKDCANVKNRGGFTALDVIEHCPNRDLKSMEIREFLLQAGVQISNLNLESPPEDCPPPPPPPPPRHYHCVRNVLNMMGQCIARFWTKYFAVDSSWLKEVRGHLITAATLTATMAYQAILSPPAGFWQEDKVSTKTGEAPSPAGLQGDDNTNLHNAGEAILDSNYFNHGTAFIRLNSVVLFASLCTIMLALSGFPNTNKLLVWLMIFTVYITLSCMAIAYGLAVDSLFPNKVKAIDSVIHGVLLAWFSAIGFVLVLHTCHFLVWLVKKLIKAARCLVWLVKKFAKLVRRQLGPNNYIPQNSATTSSCCIGNYWKKLIPEMEDS